MESRDYLLIQIEQLSRFLGKVLADFLRLKSNNPNAPMEEINVAMKSQMGLDLYEMISLPIEDVVDKMQGNRSYSDQNLEDLCRLVETIAFTMDGESDERKKFLDWCLKAYAYVDTKSDTFSFERKARMDKIKYEN